jgi:hypothetical protein
MISSPAKVLPVSASGQISSWLRAAVLGRSNAAVVHHEPPSAAAPTMTKARTQLVLADRLCALLAAIEPATPGIPTREDHKPRVPHDRL